MKRKYMKIKDNLDYYGKSIKTVSKNVAEFCDAAALAGVSGYSIYESIKPEHSTFWYRGLLVGAVLIALQAFVLLVKHFNKPIVGEAPKKNG
jgi:hypothetical protein